MGFLDRIRQRRAPAGLDPDLEGLHPTSIDYYLETGAWANPQLARRVGTVARCLQLVSQQIATLPLRFRGGYQPLWVSDPDPIWFPGGFGDAAFAVVASVYGWGDAFLWVTSRYESGYPQTFTVLDPAAVTVKEADAGGRAYRVGQTELDPDDVLQISRTPGALRGTSALQAYASNVASAVAAEAYATDIYANGGVPWAVLQPSRRLDAEQAADLQAQWMARASARGAVPAVIPPDIAFKEFAFNPKDLMLLESREWDAKQIASAFGIPAFMLNLEQAGGLNYSNPEMLFSTWWRSELYPTAHRVEANLSTWLPRGSWVEFDPSALVGPDVAGRLAIAKQALADGAMSVDEYRAYVFDLPPLAEGDALDLIDEPPGAQATPVTPAPTIPPALEVVASE